MTTEIPIMVRDVDGLADGHRVTAVCVSGDTAAHSTTGEVIEPRRGVVGTALSLPAVDELTPTGCYWRVQARTWTWLIEPRSTTPLTDGSVLVGDPAIQATTTAPPATWPTGSRLPAGGTAGQVLTKDTGDDYAASWQTGGGGGGAVASVNGKTGTVVLTAADVTADPAGSAATAQAAAISTAATDATTKVATETARATAAEAGRVTAVTANAKLWIGTAAAYTALGTYDPTTLYVTT